MSLGLHHLREIDTAPATEQEGGTTVDIVAVHGLNEDAVVAWTSESGTLWLRDLIPLHVPQARILSFGYESSASSYEGQNFTDKIQSLATTLVANLEGDRSLEDSNWLVLDSSDSRASQFACRRLGPLKSPPTRILQSLEAITDQFTPLMKKFHATFFWEGMPTDFGGYVDFLVDQSSAAPNIYDAPKCAIVGADHSQMIKFSDWSPSYRTVLSTVKRYCRMAPEVIVNRWRDAHEALALARTNEAQELAGFRFSIPDKLPDISSIDDISHDEMRNQYCETRLSPSENYIGRDDVSQKIREALVLSGAAQSRQGQKRFIVHGIPGSGKSQLCTNFAWDNRQCYWAVFTIDATTPTLAAKSFAAIGKIGGLEGTESSGKYFLSQAREPWLLIIDNADSPNLHLPSLFPPGNRGHILVTTRNRVCRKYGNVGSIELGGLQEKEALYLLLKSAMIDTPWDMKTEKLGREIAKALGYLALAMKQAGTSISQRLCNLSEYLGFYEYYRKKRQRGTTAVSEVAIENPTSKSLDDDIYSAFDLSFEYLEKKPSLPSQDAVEMLNIVSFYHFDHIRIDIFERALENRRRAISSSRNSVLPSKLDVITSRLSPPPSLPCFLKRRVEDTDSYYVREVLHELYTLSFISYDKDLKSFCLHPLVHAWARDRINPRERNIWALIAMNTLMESVSLPSKEDKDADIEYRKDILSHLDACSTACPVQVPDFSGWLGNLRILAVKFLQPTVLFMLRDQVLLAAKCGYLYALSGRFSLSAQYLTMVRDLLTKIQGSRHEKTLEASMYLAEILWGLGRLKEGIAIQRAVVGARSEHVGPFHRDALQAKAKLGQSFWLNGQYAESLQVLEDTTSKMIQNLGPEDSDTMIAMDYLGVTLGSWQRYEESKAMHERVLLIRKREKGEDHIDTLSTMSNLAMVLLDLRQLERAKHLMDRVYQGRKKQLGKEHPYTLWALCYLSKIHVELGFLDRAEEMLVGGIAAGKRSLGDDHLGVLMGCGELARVYARQGRLDEAEQLSLTTLEKVKESRGPEHFDYIFGMWKLGQLYEMQGGLEQALDAYRVALDNTETRLTRQHPLSKQIEMRIAVIESKPRLTDETKHGDKSRDIHAETTIRGLQSTHTW
ncbi:hypothetical protein EYZ11_000272 [Aspergillus tanneri]|uniref:NB-ARC domain-containing protein n=1 Tax=Aspergillus tanneri TaxID=1220188 RepID=A0A4S3JXF7_9EURO|nr:hypothetical protein EYZ11_000272 [Aspergillus tanneri]